MTTTAELAAFARDVEYESLSGPVRDELKKRLLDSLGIAVGAMEAETSAVVRSTVDEYAGDGDCRLWGSGRHTSPVAAAMYNTTLVRYLDYMDSFLAPGETPHPSDNVAAVLAVAEQQGRSGAELLASLAVAYEVQGELAWNAPVRGRGWDHVTHTVVSAATAAGDARGLDTEQLRNAIGIAGTAHNALRVTRTGGINEWKGVASANAARNAVHSVVLADHGMEGPVDLFEGQKGWKEVISGPFQLDLDTGCERVLDTMTKRYVAETYAQSAVEGIVELAAGEDIDHERVEAITLQTFHGAALIIGGGEGNRHDVQTKAQADHSLPYMLSAALVDGELTRESYTPERIHREGVQRLLETVSVDEDDTLTERFEAGAMPAIVDVAVDDGTVYRVEKDAFAGHPSKPMSWDDLVAKFESMTADRYDEAHRDRIVETVRGIEDHEVADLVALLD
ncbi:MmgE/PrpD family protein [Haloarchaeobius litoreus]|uniref:MmgE/PrpD family protein n=1 Tax=Haloarchaeobius litoreus TaxID=755306 RepID=A0ABD6DRJ8_9EURY|nr:MmgE/PrpD family protein [Haloarchaeobius litoreus]